MGALWQWGRSPSGSTLLSEGARAASSAAGQPLSVSPSPAPPEAPLSPSTVPDGTAGTDGTDGTDRTEVGIGRTEPGIRMEAVTAADGSITVTEQVRLLSSADFLQLSVPDLTLGGPAFAAARPSVRDVRLTVGGRDVPVSSGAADGSQLVPLPAPTTVYELHYVVAGTTVRSMPSRSGRALAALAPISRPEVGTYVVVATRGASVLNLTCPLLLESEEVTCSDGNRGRMGARAPLPDSAALVVLQLELEGAA